MGDFHLCSFLCCLDFQNSEWWGLLCFYFKTSGLFLLAHASLKLIELKCSNQWNLNSSGMLVLVWKPVRISMKFSLISSSVANPESFMSEGDLRRWQHPHQSWRAATWAEPPFHNIGEILWAKRNLGDLKIVILSLRDCGAIY